MELQETIIRRQKSRRQILFSREDPCIQLLQVQIDRCSRQAVISWALDLAEETVCLLEQKYPNDPRAREALTLTWQWARGEIKMPVAKGAILACHGAAKEISDWECIAHYHAIGQACGTVHANGHAIGYPIYDLTALIRKEGVTGCENLVHNRIMHYSEKLRYWCVASKDSREKWADFILNGQNP